MMKGMTRTLLGILTAIVAIIVALVATVFLGVKESESAPAGIVPAESAAEPAATSTPATPDPLAEARVNRVIADDVPAATDSFGSGTRHFEHARTWSGEIEVWRGSRPQLILGPEENWFPAGQPGCADGRYLVEFAGVDKQAELTGLLVDELGETTHELATDHGWMLLDDCHLPYVQLSVTGETAQTEVAYEVHEYHRVH